MNDRHMSLEPILRTATGFMASRLFGAAVELRVFELLGNESAGLGELAERTGVFPQRLRVLLDAVVAIGFLERHADSYRCTPVARAYLTDEAQVDLRPFVRFMHRMRYESWLGIEEVIRSGADAVEEKTLSPDQQRVVSDGIAAVTSSAAHALAERYDFSPHVHMLDLGGGVGSFLVPTLIRFPQLRATLLDRTEVAEVARQRLTDSGLLTRVSIRTGDFFTCELPAGADVILLANVVHIFSPQRNRQLLGRLRESAGAGAGLLLVDFWTDDSHAEPAFAAIMAGEFLMASGEGAVYSVGEIGDWLETTGWRLRDHVALAGPASLIVAEAV